MPDNAVQIVQFGSPFLPRLNTLLLWFKEAGLDQYSRKRLNLKLSVQNGAPEVQCFSYEDVSPAFNVLGVGLSVSFLAFMGELLGRKGVAFTREWNE